MSDYAEDRFHRKLDAALVRVGERDETAAQIAHLLSCTRCAMGWECGGVSVDDFRLGERIADLLAQRIEQAKAEALREAADDLARLDEIGQTRRDLISDEAWAWFVAHPLREHAPHSPSEVARAAAEWLRDCADRIEARDA